MSRTRSASEDRRLETIWRVPDEFWIRVERIFHFPTKNRRVEQSFALGLQTCEGVRSSGFRPICGRFGVPNPTVVDSVNPYSSLARYHHQICLNPQKLEGTVAAPFPQSPQSATSRACYNPRVRRHSGGRSRLTTKP